MDYASQTTSQLKAMAISKAKDARQPRSWIQTATKDALVSYLDGTLADLPTAATPRADQIAGAVTGTIGDGFDAMAQAYCREHAKQAVDDELATRGDLRPVVKLQIGQAPAIDLPATAHAALPRVIGKLAVGLPVLLVGPSGSGKTYLARQAAQVLGRSFTHNSMSAGTTESSLLGRVLPDATGAWSYKESPLVATYRDGGIHLFDEVDAADANLMVVLNAALANGHLSIPAANLEIPRHKDCALICAANTFGLGADRQYVGRNQLDAATLDRFAASTIYIDYDLDLERGLARAICGDSKADNLLAWTYGVRAKIGAARLRRIMSTRTIESMAKCLAAGEKLNDLQADYFVNWTAEEKGKMN